MKLSADALRASGFKIDPLRITKVEKSSSAGLTFAVLFKTEETVFVENRARFATSQMPGIQTFVIRRVHGDVRRAVLARSAERRLDSS
jgi:hypothetical protein